MRTYNLVSGAFAQDLFHLVADFQQAGVGDRANLRHQLRTDVRIRGETQLYHHI